MDLKRNTESESLAWPAVPGMYDIPPPPRNMKGKRSDLEQGMLFVLLSWEKRSSYGMNPYMPSLISFTIYSPLHTGKTGPGQTVSIFKNWLTQLGKGDNIRQDIYQKKE